MHTWLLESKPKFHALQLAYTVWQGALTLISTATCEILDTAMLPKGCPHARLAHRQ